MPKKVRKSAHAAPKDYICSGQLSFSNESEEEEEGSNENMRRESEKQKIALLKRLDNLDKKEVS